MESQLRSKPGKETGGCITTGPLEQHETRAGGMGLREQLHGGCAEILYRRIPGMDWIVEGFPEVSRVFAGRRTILEPVS